MQNESNGGNKYFITFIDDHSRMCWVHFLRNKSNTFIVFKKFKALFELQSGYKLKKLRSDRGGEYTSREFESFCAGVGIEKQLIVAYSPQQNRMAKRKNRTIVEMARSMTIKKVFDEDKSLNWEGEQQEAVISQPWYRGLEMNDKTREEKQTERIQFVGDETCSPDVSTGNATECSSHQSSPTLNPVKLKYLQEIYARCHMSIVEPENYKETTGDIAWEEAMNAKLEMIEKNNTWELVNKPADKPVIGVKWVFKTKLNLDGTIHKHKKKFMLSNPRALWSRRQNTRCINLKKAFYGLKQASRSLADSEGKQIIVSIYVDDIIYASNNEELMNELKRKMMQRYEITDLGLLHHFLGMRVLQTSKWIFIHQSKYAKSLLKSFDLEDCKLCTDALLYIKWVFERYKGFSNFFFCCNDVSSLLPIRSLCTADQLFPPSKKEVVEVLEFIAKPEGIELPYPLAEKIADNSKNNLRQAIRSFEASWHRSYPFTEDQEILTGWEDDIANIAKDMVEGQSPKQHIKSDTVPPWRTEEAFG
uniref:Integrase catalytic domain-containing protein n=1 Tax=Salix viminalis TaxID=40686 RepID=A0A6N2KMP1_SALVM